MMKLRAKSRSSMFGVRSSEFETPNRQLRTPNAQLRTDKRVARGAVQIEFALTIIIVMFVMFWMWELIMLTYTMDVMGDAAHVRGWRERFRACNSIEQHGIAIPDQLSDV